MTKRVYIVTDTELGMDCIVGVFDSNVVLKDELEKKFPKSSAYMIFSKEVEIDFDWWY